MANETDNNDGQGNPLTVTGYNPSAIDVLRLPPVLHSLAEALMYQIYKAGSLEQLNWAHGRAEGFALGLDMAKVVTGLQGDYLTASYKAARQWREEQLQASK